MLVNIKNCNLCKFQLEGIYALRCEFCMYEAIHLNYISETLCYLTDSNYTLHLDEYDYEISIYNVDDNFKRIYSITNMQLFKKIVNQLNSGISVAYIISMVEKLKILL